MKKKWSSSDESSSDDDVPLASSSHDGKGRPSGPMVARRERSVQNCEFCDEVFCDKYSILVHNAKHIIIPLLKAQIPQCPECLHHFPSTEALQSHTRTKHPDIIRTPNILQSLQKQPAKIDKTPGKEMLLQSFVRREPVTVPTKEKSTLHNEVVYEISDDSNDQCGIVKANCESDKSYFKCKDSNSTVCNKTIKDKLKFEDEIESDINDGKLDFGTFKVLSQKPVQAINNVASLNGWRKNAIILGRHPVAVDTRRQPQPANSIPEYNLVDDEAELPKSVHYEELVKPGVHKCKRCRQSFPNRYQAIVHESSHMRNRRRLPFLCRLCDWYITVSPKGLAAHKKRKHPDMDWDRNYETRRCPDCGLHYVRHSRHLWNYHREFTCSFNGCNSKFDSWLDLERHTEAEHQRQAKDASDDHTDNWISKEARVCDICCSFFRNKSNLTYGYFGEFSEVGVRHACERCQRHCFTLNVVRLSSKRRVRHNNPLEEFGARKRPLSNVDRLKNVQQRLKKLKNLNKF